MSRPKFLKNLEGNNAPESEGEPMRTARPIALFRCENCKRNKWFKKDWHVPPYLICLICGNRIMAKIIKPDRYDEIRAEQKAFEERIGWTGYEKSAEG